MSAGTGDRVLVRPPRRIHHNTRTGGYAPVTQGEDRLGTADRGAFWGYCTAWINTA